MNWFQLWVMTGQNSLYRVIQSLRVRITWQENEHINCLPWGAAVGVCHRRVYLNVINLNSIDNNFFIQLQGIQIDILLNFSGSLV